MRRRTVQAPSADLQVLLVQNFGHATGADGAATFANGEAIVFSIATGVINSISTETLSPGITISTPSATHRAGDIGGAEIELRTVIGEERRVTATFFLHNT